MKPSHGGESPHKELGEMSLLQIKALREQLAERRGRSKVLPLVPQERDRTLPLSFAQERLWFLDQLGLMGPAYNSQMVLRFDGDLKIETLERCFAELIRRHEILRTRFESIAGSPIQIVDQPQPFVMDIRDLLGLEEQDKASRVQQVSSMEARRSFDLAVGPLLRTTLLRFSDEEHVLVLTIHHIVFDGWSWGVLNKELGALYAAFLQGQPSPLQDLPVQYADYAIWQRRWLDGDVLQGKLQYWRERFIGAPPELGLPTDRPRCSVPSFMGARRTFDIPAVLRGALEKMARREGTTLFMVLLAAYQLLLARHCGQDDIVVGVPVAGRTHAQIERLIGFFVNTLVMRTSLSGNPSFRQLLQNVKEVALGAYANQDLPFEKLVMELRPERNLMRQPIFQVVMALQNYPQEQLELPGLKLTRIESVNAHSTFDLTLHLFETPNGLRGTFVYATDLFDFETIARMADHFLVMLEGVAANPDSLVQQVPILRDDECRKVLYEFNEPGEKIPQDRLIHELFEEQAQRTPDAVAVVYNGECLRYAEINSRSNQLARHLRDKGIGINQFVGLCVDRSLEMVIGVLGILKAGGAYLPLDPNYPTERLAYVLKDAAPKVLLTHAQVRAILPVTSAEVIELDTDWNEIGERETSNVVRLSAMRCDHLAYVIYTSGSTGAPKGVMVEHRNVTRLFGAADRWFNFTDKDVWTLFHSVAFDFSVWELWGALLYGGRVVVVPYWKARSPHEFYRLLCQEGVTVLNQTPSAFAQLVDAQALSAEKHSLRVIIFGGEALELRTLQPWLKRSGGKEPRLVNMYGITETTVHVTYSPITEEEIESERGCLIGSALPDLQLYLLDRCLRPVPIGVAGEMYIGGAGVARGYLNRPELTAERFIADPFGVDSGARLYKTGDLGRWRRDGTVEYLGRNDQQVKLRGFRIELGEIEAQLLRHPLVKEAVVVARNDASGDKYLVAYVARRGESELTVELLHAQLANVLPEFMIPSAFVVLDTFPLTSNGKLDRNALPAPSAEAYSRREYEAPQGEVEEHLAEMWRSLLRIERVGREDSFFELGGHSLLVLKALFLVNQSFGVVLTARDIYQSPTLRELAERVRGKTTDDGLVDLLKEATLEAEIRVESDIRCVPAKAIMLTGGTGFVGRFLLARLLLETDATIHCLVRAPSQNQGLDRLKSALAKWNLWRDEFEARIVAIPGDLRLPRLGIENTVYQLLSQSIDSIYHCATSMNHLETYAIAKPANVGSARELLRFATNTRPKLTNYISTLSVFSSLAVGANRVIDETSSIDLEQHPAVNGYAASKWVAEKIFMIAQDRGIPCNIFRLGLVWADSLEGRYDELQREYRVLKSCLLSGIGIKNYRYAMPPTPIDYVARSVTYLAERESRRTGIFHICASGEMIEDVFGRCNEVAGTSLELLPYYDWICEMKRLHRQGRVLPIVPLIEFAFSMDEESFYERHSRFRSHRTHIDCARTNRALGKIGDESPKFNDDVLRLCVEYMCSTDPDLREVINCGRNRLLTRKMH